MLYQLSIFQTILIRKHFYIWFGLIHFDLESILDSKTAKLSLLEVHIVGKYGFDLYIILQEIITQIYLKVIKQICENIYNTIYRT